MAINSNQRWIKGYSRRFGQDVALAIIPKNGSTSFRNALSQTESYTNVEILRTIIRLFFMRHPQKRFISGWSFFYGLNNNNANGRLDDVPLSVTHNEDGTPNYKGYVDHILSTDNGHWHSQTLLIEDSHTIAYRFEDLHNIWQYYYNFKPPNMNKSIKLETTDYRIDELKIKYAEDIDYYLSIPIVDTPMFERVATSTDWF